MDDTYQPTSDYVNQAGHNAADAVLIGYAVLLLGFLLFLSYIICAFLTARIFKKAGIPKWVAWVPFYNLWRFLELGGQKGFWAIFFVVPFINWVATIFTYIAAYHIGKKLGKDDWFVLLAIFLPIVWLAWLAYDRSKWPEAKHPHKQPAPHRKST